MKKQITAMLLSALLLTNATACDIIPDTPEQETESTAEGTTTVAPDVEEVPQTETKPPRKGPDFINGVRDYDSKGIYTFNQNSEFSIYIADWDESHLFTSLADEDIAAAKYYAAAIGVNHERAFLILNRYYESKITAVSFEKGSVSETVANLDVDENVYRISGMFINENIGYIFAFKEESEIHPSGDSKLSNLFKTEDGGKTWESINVQSFPSISLRENVIFAKMLNPDIGLISGGYGAADYNFCERTLLTTDGGLNWVHITGLPQIDGLCGAEVTDFTQVEDAYILTVRYETPEGIDDDDDDAKYKSTDLNTWIRIC